YNSRINAADRRLKTCLCTKQIPKWQRAGGHQDAREEDRKERENRTAQTVGLRLHNKSKIGSKGEKRSGNRLRCAVAGDELLVCDPPGRYNSGLQQGQDNVAAPEYKRSSSIKTIEHGQRLTGNHLANQREDQQKSKEHDPADCSDPLANWHSDVKR